MSKAEQSFVRGAAILGLAALVSKILGAVYRVPYQNITGDEGMYVYQQVYPLYSTLLILATAGFPTAISKLVSERLAEGDSETARRIFRVASVTLFLTGCLFFVLLFFGAEIIATWMGNRPLLTMPIQSVSFALVIVPFLSAIRGYFQGQQNMMPTATSQVMEQVVRVATILLAAWYFMEEGLGYVYAGAGAVFGATTGAIAAFIVLMVYWKKRVKSISAEPGVAQAHLSTRQLVFRILALSVPICIGSLVLPLYSLVDSFTVGNLLVDIGWQMERVITGKGVFDRGQPLIQFGSFFATAIALSIVPAIAEAKTLGREEEAAERAALALRLTWLFGLPASVGLAVIALPTNVMLYKDGAGSDALAILAFTILFSTLSLTSAGILQGFGRVYMPALHLSVGVAVKLAGNLLLIPLWDIRGAALATTVAYACAAGLNLWALKRHLHGTLRQTFRLGKSLWSALWMAIAVGGVMLGLEAVLAPALEYRLAMTTTSLTSVITGIVVYVWALFRFGVLTRADLEKVPKLKTKVLPLLDKWQWLRS
ncbi:putative polysaccharide biosynthesis protein [Laceyella putida]|uniref:Oligosaccharide flippase family protein n=1 Tax=Laceyella putida TaxID=110101 RepID=A0ABW2RQW6_9BACL